MLVFRAQPPAPPLDQYVEAIWMVKADGGLARDKVLPNGLTELIVNLGASSHGVVDEHDSSQNQRFHEAWVAGTQERQLIIDGVQETDLIGIRFKPGGAFPLLDIPMSELTNDVLEWRDLPPLDIGLLREELLEAGTLDARMQTMERYLRRRLDISRGIDPRLAHVLAELRGVREPRPIRDISAEVGLSHRSLISQFRTQVGLTPKRVGRIYRLQSVVARVAGRTSVNWASVAQECGYSDQAHMIREFRDLAGATPTEYLARRYENDIGHMELDS